MRTFTFLYVLGSGETYSETRFAHSWGEATDVAAYEMHHDHTISSITVESAQ